MDASEFKNYILGVIFFKFISDKCEKFYKKQIQSEGLSLEKAWDEPGYAQSFISEAKTNLGYAIRL